MHILITGGTGFIGQLFIEASTKDQFTVVSRNPEKARQQFQQHPQVVAAISLDELTHLNHFHAVINLAGEPIIDKRWSAEQKSVIQASRWRTTEHLIACFEASEQPPEVFISGSAIGIYGEQADHVLSETADTTANDFSADLCQQWEQRAQQIADKCRLVILRTGIVLHPQFGALQRMILPFKFALGGPIGSGQHYFSWIHWQDMINAIRYLLDSTELAGVFNMTAPNPVTNKAFAKALGHAVNRPAILPMPPLALCLLLGEASELLTVSQRVVPTALTNAGFSFAYPEVDDCLENLL